MKNKFSNSIRIVAMILVFGAVVSVAHAQWTTPSGPFPAGNVAAPVNTGAIDQTKAASFSVTNAAGANLSANANVNGRRGFFADVVNSVRARFGCFSVLCSVATLTSSNIFEAGSYISGALGKGLIVTSGGIPVAEKTSFWINLTGNTGVAGRNALFVNVSNDNTTTGAVLQTNADRFSLWNVSGTDRVGLAAKSIQLTEGAGDGKILISDASGNGSWTEFESTTTGGLIKYVRASGSGSYKEVTCGGSEWMAIGGGGYCQYGTQRSEPITGSNQIHGNGSTTAPATGWRLDCLDRVAIASFGSVIADGGQSGVAEAEVICMRKDVALALAPGTPSIPEPEDPGQPHVATWHSLPSSVTSAQNATSCQTWLNANSGVIATASQAGGGANTFAPGSSNVGAAEYGLTNPTDIGNCAYTGTYVDSNQVTKTICTSRSRTLSGPVGFQVDIGGYNYVNYSVPVKPVSTCNGLDPNNQLGETTWVTKVKW